METLEHLGQNDKLGTFGNKNGKNENLKIGRIYDNLGKNENLKIWEKGEEGSGNQAGKGRGISDAHEVPFVFLLIRVSRRRWGAGGGITRARALSGAFRH